MAVQTRTIKRRIKSVSNTKKITKAMELVAASKMRRAVSNVLGSRSYAKLLWDMVKAVSNATNTDLHPLLKQKEEVKNVLMIVLSSDRGLAGGYNVNIIRKTLERIGEQEGKNIRTICIGKRGSSAMKRAGIEIAASFTELTNNPKYEDVRPISKMITDEFIDGTADSVQLVYTDFISALTQKPIILDLLPLTSQEAVKELGDVGKSENGISPSVDQDYTFEPDARSVLDRLLPRLIDIMTYQAVLEATASEHSARMMAMRSATDAASDMLEELTFTFNQARQAGITQEIAEISSGKAALEG